MSYPDRFTLEDLKKVPIESILQSVSLGRQSITVYLPDGHEVVIQPYL